MGLPLPGFFPMSTMTAQGNEADSTAKSLKQKASLYAGAAYGSNLIYMGSTISRNLPYYTGSLTFGLGNSVYVSASVSHIIKTSPYIAFYSLSTSYNHTVNSWFDYSASLAYYKTPESLQETLFSDFAFLNLTTGFDWKLIYTKLSFSGLFSKASSGYVQIRNSHYFQTGQFFNGKAFLSFDPNINTLFGRLVKIETNTGISKFGNAPPFVQLKKKQNNTTYTYSYVFGLLDTEFSVPITLNFTNFSVEAETIYILPAYSNPDYPAPKGFSLNISAYFRFL
jgi:hypothetical protein